MSSVAMRQRRRGVRAHTGFVLTTMLQLEVSGGGGLTSVVGGRQPHVDQSEWKCSWNPPVVWGGDYLLAKNLVPNMRHSNGLGFVSK